MEFSYETQKNFFYAFNEYFINEIKISKSQLSMLLEEEIRSIKSRAEEEKYWERQKMIIQGYI